MTEETTKETKTVKLKPAEIEKKIVELAKAGTPSEKIGLILRDQHGVAKTKMFGKRIGQILRENDLYEDSEHKNIENKIENLKKHFEKNKHDYSAKKSLLTYSARLNKRNRMKAARN